MPQETVEFWARQMFWQTHPKLAEAVIAAEARERATLIESGRSPMGGHSPAPRVGASPGTGGPSREESPMDLVTGNFVQTENRDEAIAKLRALRAGLTDHDVVEIRGHVSQVEELSRRVQLGEAEQERRRARRKAQRTARKRNR